MAEKFLHAALFLPIRHENAGFRFRGDGIESIKQSFSKTMTFWQLRDFPACLYLKHKSKMTNDCCVFKFLWGSVRKNIWAFSEWKKAVSKFLQRRQALTEQTKY